MPIVGVGIQRLPKVLSALAIAALATASSLYLFAFSGQERFEPLQIAGNFADSLVKPGRPLDSQTEVIEEPAEPAPEAIEEKVNLDQAVYIQDFLQDTGMGAVEAEQWANAFRSAAYTGLMHGGHRLLLYKDPESGKVRGLQYEIDDKNVIAEEAVGNGVVLATQQPLRYITRPVSVSFGIQGGIERDALQHHIPRSVVDRLKEALNPRITADSLKPGMAVKLIYEEQVSPDGAHQQIGDLQAVQVNTGTQTYSAFYFRDEHGLPHFYDEQGKPIDSPFLRYPVNFSYISSGFSTSRYHPILHRYRPHTGVDLAAKYGTPVKAVADGRVDFSDWDGELGRCIRLAHEQNLLSLYGHLSKISPAVTPGAPVHTGQVIGWVGASGLATGPHLHFALFKDGAYINPLTVKFTGGAEISSRTLPVFEKLKHECMTTFSRLPDHCHAVSVDLHKPPTSPAGDMLHVDIKALAKPSHRKLVASSSHRSRSGRSASDADVDVGTGSL